MNEIVFFLLTVIYPLIGVVQLILALIFHYRRSLGKEPTVGWWIYWGFVFIAFLMGIKILLFRGNGDGLIFYCVIPAVWFFLAGPVSDKLHEIDRDQN